MIVKDMAATAIVAASTTSRGIGWKGDLPWKLPGDMKHFKEITMGSSNKVGSSATASGSATDGASSPTPPAPVKQNAVIMGRNTWESIPTKFRPLQGRTNVVLTRKATFDVPSGVLVAQSLEDAWNQLGEMKDSLDEIFIIEEHFHP